MKRYISLAMVLVLTLAMLACGFSRKAEPTEVPPATDAPAPTSTQPAPTDVPKPTSPPAAALGEEYVSDAGGFGFQVVPGYLVEGAFGFISMEAPDADPDLGPAFLLMGGESAVTSNEELYGQFTADLETGIEVAEPYPLDMGGVEGLATDVSGSMGGQAIMGQMAFVKVEEGQQFSMFAIAPVGRWDEEMAPLVDAVAASLFFFPPVMEAEFEFEAEPESSVTLTRQWAISAIASSEYSNPNWSAMQATGAPDTFECGDFTTAWAASDSDTVEWIELTYDVPVLPTEVNIIQTYNPNHVLFVDLLDVYGEYHEIYLDEPQDVSGPCPYTLSIPVEDADYQAVAVRITIDQTELMSWNEIDAVELVGIADRPGMVAPEPESTSGDLSAGSFYYEVIGADEDAVIDGGLVQDNSSYSEYGLAFVEEGALARYSMTLYLPHDVAPGEMALQPYVRSDTSHAPSAAAFIGAWFYFATEGTVIVDEVVDNTASGSFWFEAVHQEDPDKVVTFTGWFDQIPLGQQ